MFEFQEVPALGWERVKRVRENREFLVSGRVRIEWVRLNSRVLPLGWERVEPVRENREFPVSERVRIERVGLHWLQSVLNLRQVATMALGLNGAVESLFGQ